MRGVRCGHHSHLPPNPFPPPPTPEQKANFKFDLAYTSVLKRAIHTLWLVLEETDQMWIPEKKSWRLNERHYGALQGLNKKETVAKHGVEQVNIWRRSYDIPPPALDASSEHYPGNDPRYKDVPKAELPFTESLKTTKERFMPLWEKEIVPDIESGKRLVIAAHGNTIRALVQHLDDISGACRVCLLLCFVSLCSGGVVGQRRAAPRIPDPLPSTPHQPQQRRTSAS